MGFSQQQRADDLATRLAVLELHGSLGALRRRLDRRALLSLARALRTWHLEAVVSSSRRVSVVKNKSS